MSASPDLAWQTVRDADHLQLLVIFHYLSAALTGALALFPVLHLVVGLGLLGGWLSPADADARMVGALFVTFAAAMIAAGLAFAGLLAWTGRNLARRRRPLACMIVAGVACAAFPLGTALGVCTLVVLVRPSVKTLFERDAQ
ncbi:hypothetical protein [Luteimonas deserti]|uniref:Uncharacterized protein n=1 Tax=Luteimonas deserti TaxID=2752306 RepID=A0A7Z0QRS5_9GAMM|nr:hypothetical protein [Luteimonas deserti]NYZ63657.1 hypothetical protein [Luteimonas deserti]